MTGAIYGTLLLSVVTWTLFIRIGFAVDKRRAEGWMSLAVLYLMWGVYLLILDRETGYTSMVTAIVFVSIALHRKRIDDPNSTIGRWVGDHFPKWLTFHDLGERRQRSDQ